MKHILMIMIHLFFCVFVSHAQMDSIYREKVNQYYQGGINALEKLKNTNYETPHKNDLDGIVVLGFILDTSGINDIQVIQPLSEKQNKNCINILSQSKGKWKLSNSKDTRLPCRIEIQFEFNPIPTADLKPLKEEMAEKYQVEKWEECLVLIDQIIRHQPYEAYMHMGRGLILNKLNNKETACNSWRRAFELGNTESHTYIQQYCE